MRLRTASVVVLAVALAGCSSPDVGSDVGSARPSSSTAVAAGSGVAVTLPPAHGRFDLQLGGSYAPVKAVKIVDRDRTSAPVKGKYNLCYVNAFQTQDSEKAFWMNPARADLLLRGSDGAYVTDPGWPGEYILDTRTPARRTRIAAIVNRWVDGCAARGYQAVDPDNLDTWTRFDALTRSGNLALAGLVADHAHRRGLAIGQKNAAELGSLGRREVGFDFAVVESCQVYDECDRYTAVYGAHVLEVEYTDTARSAFTKACAARGKTASVILRDHDLVPRGHPEYVYEVC